MLQPAARQRVATFALLAAACLGGSSATCASAQEPILEVRQFIESRCVDCHSGSDAEAQLDLSSLAFELSAPRNFDRWVLIHDRIRDGEMPPPDGIARPILAIGESARSNEWNSDSDESTLESHAGVGDTGDDFQREATTALRQLAAALAGHDRARVSRAGRASMRRLNRLEYENTLRQLLESPWLQVRHLLPEDGVAHLFNKVGTHLDSSHVQMSEYLKTARFALEQAVNAAAYPSTRRKFYARDEPAIQNYVHYRFGQRAATRSIVPLVGLTPEPDVIRRTQPMTVGDADPAKREREAMGVFSGVYSATTKYDFTRINAPIDGRYRLRFKTYTFMAGPGGAAGGDDHGLTGGNRAWWRPDRNVALIGKRTEPITLYALSPGGDSRWLTTFDSRPEPSVFECMVDLRKGEGLRPDASRLVRTRPGWSGNPNATKVGVPGFAMNWLEVEGPLTDEWPPASYRAVFGDLPFEIEDGRVRALTDKPDEAAERLLASFHARAVTTASTVDSIGPYLKIYDRARELGEDFTDAMLSATAAVLSSPEFLFFQADPGVLPDDAFQQRLAYFLLNGPPPAHESLSKLSSADREGVSEAVDRLLASPASDRFVDAFLDYWLDLREINTNTPDAELYPDYYLDELLTESSVLETRRFFRELIDANLPVTALVDADFAFVNERLAQHYGFPEFEGVHLRRVAVPPDSPRGGLLTQASVLRVTANGTTTSPVVRGAWVMERILGIHIPPPPSGVAAVEPDIRGAKTIREQLEKHRAIESCNACHARFDPAGFALESFDVAGGWRTRYRSVGDSGDKVAGFGKNGHAFKYRLSQPVDCAGTMPSGEAFRDIVELKRLLVEDERQLARNLAQRLIVYGTGAPIGFGDRVELEKLLDRAATEDYGVKTLIREVVHSRLFTHK